MLKSFLFKYPNSSIHNEIVGILLIIFLIKVLCLDFNFNGKKVVSGSSEFKIKIWKIKSNYGICIYTIDAHIGSVMSVKFSLDGKKIVSGSSDTTVRVWNVETEETYKVLKGHSD